MTRTLNKTHNLETDVPFEHNYTIEGHSAGIYSITASKSHIYSSSGDRFIARWDKNTGIQDKFSIKFELVSYSIKFIDKTNVLVVGLSDGMIHVFDAISKKEIRCFNQHRNAIFSIEENKNRNHLYIGDQEGYLSIWNTMSWGLEMMIHLNCGKIRALHYSDSGKLLFVGKQNGEISIFETEYYNEIKSFKANEGGVSSIVYCEERDLIASGGNDAHIRIWNTEGKAIKSIPAHKYTIYSLIKFSDDICISTSRDKSIKVWSGFYEKVIQKIDQTTQGHHFSVNAALKIDQNSFATASDDTKIKCFKKL